MSRNFLNFHFNLFGIGHTITPSNANYSVVFQFFTIPWDLSRGYKTKVITLPPKISTITSNEEKNMKMSMEMLNSFNTSSSRLKFLFFVKIYDFGWKMRFLQSLKVIFVKIQTFAKRLLYGLESCIQNFRAIYQQIT